MYQDLYAATVSERTRALRLEACRHNLMKLATCCKPSALRRTSRAVIARLREGHVVEAGPMAVCGTD